MFLIIRLVICLFLLSILIFLIRKSNINYKRIAYIVSCFVALFLSTALFFIPFENVFITFHSVESAYEYTGNSTISLVVKGKNCDLVVGNKNDIEEYLIIPKNKRGWEIGLGSYTKLIYQQIIDNIAIDIYQYKDTNEYFITILNTEGGSCEISDDHSSDFLSLEKNNSYLNNTFITYYANIFNPNKDYKITVNGTNVYPWR